MRISYMSDLHLEFGSLSLPGGDILILAGDVCETVNITKPKYSQFFHRECRKYNHVLYIAGNHEHYSGDFSTTESRIRQNIPENVTFLEKQCIEIDGVLFAGTTLWTDVNRENPVSMSYIAQALNDYYIIKNSGRKLRVEDTVADHKLAVKFLQTALTDKNKPTVVITHHAPCFLSVDEYYKHDTHGNSAYYSDLSEFILDNQHIRYWIHGHMHNPSDYMLDNTRILSNPRGYHDYETLAQKFDANKNFEIN